MKGRWLAAAVLVLLLPACTGSASPRPAPAEVEAIVDALDGHWSRTYPTAVADGPAVLSVDGDADTGCGSATIDEGSFYCEDDETVYVQQTDVDGASPEALVYLLAHEYGHYLQARTEVPEPAEGTGPASEVVAYEQQADCLAGAFAGSRGTEQLARYRPTVTSSGDDAGPDEVDPREYDHGTGEERFAAFTRGFRGADCLA